MKLRSLLILCTALFAVVLTGCGDTADKNAYVDKVNKAQTEFNAASTKISTEFSTSSSPAQAAKAVSKLKGQFDALAKTLKDIKAPNDKVKPLHEQLVQAVDSASKGVGAAASQLQGAGSDPQKLTRVQLELSKTITTTSTKFSKTIDEINQALKK